MYNYIFLYVVLNLKYYFFYSDYLYNQYPYDFNELSLFDWNHVCARIDPTYLFMDTIFRFYSYNELILHRWINLNNKFAYSTQWYSTTISEIIHPCRGITIVKRPQHYKRLSSFFNSYRICKNKLKRALKITFSPYTKEENSVRA